MHIRCFSPSDGVENLQTREMSLAESRPIGASGECRNFNQSFFAIPVNMGDITTVDKSDTKEVSQTTERKQSVIH